MEDKSKKKLSKLLLKSMKLESMDKVKGGDDTWELIDTETSTNNSMYKETYIITEDEKDGIIC